MTEFHQDGIVTNLHSLYEIFDRETYLYALEEKLEDYSRHLHLCLLLPCLVTELYNRAVMDPIVKQIRQVRYLDSVIVAFGGTSDPEEFAKAKEYFGRLETDRRKVRLVWIDGPNVQRVFQIIRQRELPVGEPGKGQSVWMTLGYIFGLEEADVIALHDCDIVTYDRVLLGRLIEPVANPNNDFEFCKGYYARVSPTERSMKGRVTRLFVAPFVDTLRDVSRTMGYPDLEKFFSYHRMFKYPLAGEFSFTARLGRGLNVSYDWGLEVSTLSEVYDRVIPRKISQIDLTPNYEHKHQDLSPGDRSRGLHRMVIDIAKFFMFHMRSNGFPLDDPKVNMIRHTFYQNCLKYIKAYSDDAEVNSLAFDRYKEEQTARHFRDFIWTAWEQCREQAEGTQIFSWNRVVFSVPDIYALLIDAVERDNA